MTGTAPHNTPNPRGIPAAAIAMIGWAASGVISKGITELGAFSVVFWRMWIYTAIVLVFLKSRGTPLTMRSIKLSLKGGISLGIDVTLFFAAIRLTTVANATVIVSCQPLFMMILGGRMFGEHPRRNDWVYALVALGGVAIVMFGSAGLPEWSPVGDLLSVVTLVAWTGYFIFSKKTRSQIDSFQYTGATALLASIVTTPFAVFSGQVFDMPSPSAWLWLVILSIGPGFTSHMLMNWSIGEIPAWLASTLTLAIPVSATLMAWAFLGEEVAGLQFVGMAVVLVALGGLVMGQTRPKAKS